MAELANQHLKSLHDNLALFSSRSLGEAAKALLATLGYTSNRYADFGTEPNTFVKSIEEASLDKGVFNREKALVPYWKECAFLFQLTNDEIPALARAQQASTANDNVSKTLIESFVFIAIELAAQDWSRAQLAAVTREINKRFPMPAILLFKYGDHISLAVIDRRESLRDAKRDVIGNKITVVKDVRFANPHRAHVDILGSLAIENLGDRVRPTNFLDLYNAWVSALSIQELNKRFYTELSWWYFWAVKQVHFPSGGGEDVNRRHAVAVIRLLTRLIFVWFIKEKHLVPEDLFDLRQLGGLLKASPSSHPRESNYYLAILQNLFFATLNVEIDDDENGRPRRRWASENKSGGQSGHYLIHSVYRHKELLKDADTTFKLFSTIPFLNGGLFECLDRPLTERDFKRSPNLEKISVREGTAWVLRVDGFSRRKDAQPQVPNSLFFGGEPAADLNSDLGTKDRSYPVLGLFDIFGRYKFTVDENTPLEEEVALDPELLGKVFENLLASFNEDTQATARKKSGSFYTPREVVDYMVDEALIAYFSGCLFAATPSAEDENDERIDLVSRLRRLLSYVSDDPLFTAPETEVLISAIERLKILDPACGSGAFLMGALTKLVYILKKLDPDNALWRLQNRAQLEAQLLEAKKTPDPSGREERVESAEASLAKFDRDFAYSSHADYTRKLYLIEKCIHGVDIQPIAVQIAKLRFFISLVVSQVPDLTQRANNYNITALPNLETKIVAADSLIPIRGDQGNLRTPAIEAKNRELTEANEHYFAARSGKRKRKWQERAFALRDELADLLERDGFMSYSAKQLVHWNPFDQNSHAEFFDPEWMFQIANGFDVVIGNPPYVRQEQIKDLKPKLKEHYECFTGTADLYVYFYERSIRLLKPGGAFAFITSNKWYRAKYGERLREWMTRNTRLRRIIDFGDEPVFTALAYPTIVIATRRERAGVSQVGREEMLGLNWTQQLPVEQFARVFAESAFTIPQAELKREAWQLEPPVKRRLLQRIRAAGVPLGRWCNEKLYYGVKTGFNEAFVVDAATRSTLIREDARSAEIIKPFLRGRDVKRWNAEPKDLWLLFIPWHFPLQEDSTITGASEKAERAFKKGFPAIYRHLLRYKPDLEARDRAETGIRYEWYALQRFREYWREFEQPKVIFPAIEDGVNYAQDLHGYFGNDKTNIIVSDEWRFLLAVLNSQVSWWLTKQTFSAKQGGFFEFKPMYVSQLPIPNADQSSKAMLNILVDAVVAGVGDVPRFEQLINGLVYELFFPEELHVAGIRLFEACHDAGFGRLANEKKKTWANTASELASAVFDTSHPIYAQLFDLQGVDVVRTIEERD